MVLKMLQLYYLTKSANNNENELVVVAKYLSQNDFKIEKQTIPCRPHERMPHISSASSGVELMCRQQMG